MAEQSDKAEENSRRCCPTCGTPAYRHPDRIRGEDALTLPAEALNRSAVVIGNMMPDVSFDVIKMTVEYIFRRMIDKTSARIFTDLYRHLSAKPSVALTMEEDAKIREIVSNLLTHDPSHRPVNAFSDLCE